MEERITRLEMKISYQDSIIEDLNQTVIAQQRELERLSAAQAALTEKLDELLEQSGDSMPFTRPPHY